MVWKTTLGRLLGRKFTFLKDIPAILVLVTSRDVIIVPGIDGRRKLVLFRSSPTLGTNVSLVELMPMEDFR